MKRTLNDVYEDSVFNSLNPYGKEFMVARKLPKELNQFLEPYDIRVVALITFTIFPHIKAIAAVRMMLEDFENGLYEGKHCIVVDSSGNTAHAVARVAKAFGFEDIKIVLAADVPESKKGILSALSSVEIIEVGKGKNVSKRAMEEAQKPGHVHLDQYKHMGNIRAHEMFTGPEIWRVLAKNVAVVASAMGSGGTIGGVGRFFKAKHPETIVLGVRPKLGEQVPGARDSKRMREVVTLPWEEVVDGVIEVSRKDSFIGMRRLWSAVEPQPGPTSGMAWKGLEQYLLCLERYELERLSGKNVAFVCPDDGRFYSERTTGELDPDQGI